MRVGKTDGTRKLDALLLPGIVVWLPALKLNQTEETAGDIRLVLTGTVDKTSLGHLHTQTHNSNIPYVQVSVATYG